MSNDARNALQKWAKSRNAIVTITTAPNPLLPHVSETTVRCNLLTHVFHYPVQANQTNAQSQEAAALKFLQMFRSSPLGAK
jgi:hypothetical protein